MGKNLDKIPVSPIGGKRGCLCKDNTYDSKCCEGKLYQQGIGSLYDNSNGTVIHNNTTRTKISSYS